MKYHHVATLEPSNSKGVSDEMPGLLYQQFSDSTIVHMIGHRSHETCPIKYHYYIDPATHGQSLIVQKNNLLLVGWLFSIYSKQI